MEITKRGLCLGNCRNRTIHVYTYVHNTYTSVILDSDSGFRLNQTVPDNQIISISKPIRYFDGSITGRVRVFRFGFGFGSGLWIICPGLTASFKQDSELGLLRRFGDASSIGEPWWFLVDVMKLETGSVNESCSE